MVHRLFKYEEIDYIAKGEAEISFTEFVRCKIANEERDIVGILDRNKVAISQRQVKVNTRPTKSSRHWKWELNSLLINIHLKEE